MKIILAKNKPTEFELDLPQFKTMSTLKKAKQKFKLDNYPDLKPKAPCYQFYLQFLPDTYTVQDIMPNKAMTLELFQSVYGEVEGLARFNKKHTLDKEKNTLTGYIKRYGVDIGTKKYYDKNKRLSVSKEALKLNGFDEEEIKNIRRCHAKRSSNTLKNFIDRHGEEDGCRLYQHYITTSLSTHFRVEYWTDRGYNIQDAKKRISEIQTHDLNWFIARYGEADGTKTYEKCNKLKIWKSGNKSNIETLVEEYLLLKGHEVRHTERILTYFVDLYLPNTNTIIEVFGDYWHCNPKFWDSDSYNKSIKMTAQEKWDIDNKRLDALRTQGSNVLVLWEDDIKNKDMDVLYESYIKTNIIK